MSQKKRVLGPMEGVSDFPFRLWINALSMPDGSFTPFLRLTENFPFRDIPTYFWPEVLQPEITELIWWKSHLQVMTPEPKFLLNLVDKIPFGHGIDMNCGCPSPTVTGRGSGSSLLKTSETFSTFLNECFDYLGKTPMSVKMRTGFHHAEIFEELLSGIRNLPITHLTVHGRTRDQRYSGDADWSLIALAADLMPFPVYGSGDITDPDHIASKESLYPNIAGYFIARGAIANPWIFQTKTENTLDLNIQKAAESLKLFHDLTLLWDEDNPLSYLPIVKILSKLRPLETSTLLAEANQQITSTKSAMILTDGKNTRRALARTKMVWTYMKKPFAIDPLSAAALRAGTIEELIQSVLKLDQKAELGQPVTETGGKVSF